MAIKATQTRLVIGNSSDAWDFSGVSNSLDVSLSGEKIENTRFQDTAKTYTTGDASGTIAQNGYFDDTSTGSFEQEIAESCNRLIKNAIICWNYLYLSQKLEGMDSPDQKDKLLSAISSHSPMSWAHTNLLGEYDFSDEKLKDTAGIRLPKIAA